MTGNISNRLVSTAMQFILFSQSHTLFTKIRGFFQQAHILLVTKSENNSDERVPKVSFLADRTSICRFTCQMPVAARAGLGSSQEPRILSMYPIWEAGIQESEPRSTFVTLQTKSFTTEQNKIIKPELSLNTSGKSVFSKDINTLSFIQPLNGIDQV